MQLFLSMKLDSLIQGEHAGVKGASVSTKTDSVHMFIGMYGLQFDLIYSILCGRQSIILDLVCQIC